MNTRRTPDFRVGFGPLELVGLETLNFTTNGFLLGVLERALNIETKALMFEPRQGGDSDGWGPSPYRSSEILTPILLPTGSSEQGLTRVS